MKTWDVVIAGGGIIGLALALELRKRGLTIIVVERGEPGREASHAAAGMIADKDPHCAPELRALAAASAKLYPEFIHEVEDESRTRVDFRTDGTIYLSTEPVHTGRALSPAELKKLEPELVTQDHAVFLEEPSIDNRLLMQALLKAAKHRGIEVATGETATDIVRENGRAVALRTDRTEFRGGAIVNCAGAWAGSFGPVRFPTRPVKGHMLALATAKPNLIHHVVRAHIANFVYVVPRAGGRIVIGSTAEEAGFDKTVNSQTIQKLHQAAAIIFPILGGSKMIEAWAGLRPGSEDALPLLGETDVPRYFVAAGHFRDGLLLAPITAHVMAQLIAGERVDQNLDRFAPARFQHA